MGVPKGKPKLLENLLIVCRSFFFENMDQQPGLEIPHEKINNSHATITIVLTRQMFRFCPRDVVCWLVRRWMLGAEIVAYPIFADPLELYSCLRRRGEARLSGSDIARLFIFCSGQLFRGSFSATPSPSFPHHHSQPS